MSRENTGCFIGGIFATLGLAFVIVFTAILATEAAKAKPPTRVEAVAATGFTDEQRAELAGEALEGLLASEWVIASLEAMFRDLHGEPNNYTEETVDRWAKAYYAEQAVLYADAVIHELSLVGGVAAASEALELKDD